MAIRWQAALLLPWLVTACVSTPRDPFTAASRAEERGDLLVALVHLDAVAVAHPSYPEARSAALRVERRLRDSQELLLQGLRLRAEWRDAEAIEAFEQAKTLWPRLYGIHELLAATQQRLMLLPGGDQRAEPASSTAAPVSAAELTALATPGVETARPAPVASPVVAEVDPERQRTPDALAGCLLTVEAQPTGAGPEASAVVAVQLGPAASTRVVGDDRVAARLAAVEHRLQSQQLDAALADLFALRADFPDDSRVRLRLSRVLHQRALRSYGQGELRAAIRHWQIASEVDPSDTGVQQLLAAARQELLGIEGR